MKEFTISGIKVVARDFWDAMEAFQQTNNWIQEGSTVSNWSEEDQYWREQEEQEEDFA